MLFGVSSETDVVQPCFSLVDALLACHTADVLKLCTQFGVQCPAEEELNPKKETRFLSLRDVILFFMMLSCCGISMSQ